MINNVVDQILGRAGRMQVAGAERILSPAGARLC
jgi:hypothetical protein